MKGDNYDKIDKFVSESISQVIVNMGAAVLPLTLVTVFFAVVGMILPFVLGKGPNKG